MSDEVVIPASRETVWRALNDPQVLKQCIPGCESITKHSDTSMEALVTIKLGPVKAKFTGAVTLSDLDPPNGYRIAGEGRSMMGSASGGADVRLEEVPAGTRLSYDVDAQVGGKIASLAARFIDPTARMLAGQFFEKFAEIAAAMEKRIPIPAAAETAEAAEAGMAPAKAKPARPARPRKPAARKAAAKKTAAKKPQPKAAAAKKTAAKKTAVKKSAARKPAGKKSAAKKPTAKSSGKKPAKKAASGKSAPKKAAKKVAKKPAKKKR
jgi:carbon monoxide dehydrogenase subunit G